MKNTIKATRINDTGREVRLTISNGVTESVIDELALFAGDGPRGLCITHGWLPDHIVEAIGIVIGDDAKANEWTTTFTL